MKYGVIFNGSDLITNAIRLGVDKDLFTKKFSLNQFVFRDVQPELHRKFPNALLMPGIEIFCSNRLPGPKGDKLTKEQWALFQENLSKEDAVTLRKVTVSTADDKGLDIALSVRLVEMSESCDIICLGISDVDYLPVIEFVKRKDRYIIAIGISAEHPIELNNISYQFIDMTGYLKKWVK